MKRPQVSVIIPFYDEAEHLGACLDSLITQRGPGFEVIGVDDGSTDGSDQVVQSRLPRWRGRLKLLRQAHQGPGAARNLAARSAKGKVLVFVDADMCALPGFLRLICGPILKGREHGTYVCDELVSNPEKAWSRAWSHLHGLPPGRRLPENLSEHLPVYRAIRRDLFLKAGGNRAERGVGEDEMRHPSLRLAVPAPGAALMHANPATLREVLLSARWFGRGKASYLSGGKLAALVWRHNPLKSLLAALWLFTRHGEPLLLFAKPCFDAAVLWGAFEGRARGVIAR